MFVIYQAFTIPPDGSGDNVVYERAIWGWGNTVEEARADAVKHLTEAKDFRRDDMQGLKLETCKDDDLKFLHGLFVLRKCTRRLIDSLLTEDNSNLLEDDGTRLHLTGAGELDIKI